MGLQQRTITETKIRIVDVLEKTGRLYVSKQILNVEEAGLDYLISSEIVVIQNDRVGFGYSCAAEPPVQYRLSHLSRRSEPLIKHTICMMRVYSRNALSNPYTSRMEISCSASMLVMLMR